MAKIYTHQTYADGVLLRTDDVKLTLEESSNTYTGVDAVLASNQSFHVIIDANNDGQTEGGFTIRSQGQTVDTSIERVKVLPNGQTTFNQQVTFSGSGNSVLVDDTLRISETGSGLRMTNVGAFDNNSGDFRIFGTNNLQLGGNGDGNYGIEIDTSQQITFNQAYTFPTVNGLNNQYLVNDGSGNLSWGTAVTNTMIAGTGITLNGASSSVINIGQDVATTANVTFNVVTADVVGTVSDISNHTTTDLAEGTNLYYTDARARSAFSVGGDLGYDSNTGVISFTERTDAEVRGLISVSGDLTYDSNTGVIGFAETVNYNSNNFSTDFATKTTTDLAEGTNLYYTDARVNTLLATKGYATVTGTETLTNKTIVSPTISNPTLTGNYTFTSNTTSTPAIQLTAASLNDGVGALRIDSVEPDIFLNDTDGGFSTVTFGAPNDGGIGWAAFGRNSGNDFYITVRDPNQNSGNWRNDSFVVDSSTGNISMGYDLSVTGAITGNVTGTVSSIANHSTTDLAEGSNLYYTDARFDARLATKTTSDVAEGTNQYFTDARVMTSLGSVSTNIIPDGNEVYDLGSATNKFRDLYLSSGTIYIGDTSISANSTHIELPAGSKVGGVDISTGLANTVLTVNEYRDGVLTYDCSVNTEFREKNITANVSTIQLTNLSFEDLQKQTVKIQFIQGTEAYIPGELQIGSNTTPVFWANGQVPTGTSRGIDTLTFEIVKEQFVNKYYVEGSINSTRMALPSYSAPTRITSGLVAEYNAQDPSSFYDYFENETVIADLSGNNKNATLSGSWTKPIGQDYFDFTGSGYFVTDDLSDLITTEDHTVEIWVMPIQYNNVNVWSYLGQSNPYTAYHHSGLHFNQAGIFTSARATVWDYDENQSTSAGGGQLANNWQQFVRTYDSATNTTAAFLNGSQTGSLNNSWASPHIDYSSEFRIGVGVSDTNADNSGNNVAQFYGRFGLLRVYSNNLTTQNILDNYNNTKGIYGMV